MTDEEFNKLAQKAGYKFDSGWGTCYTGNAQLKEFAEIVEAEVVKRVALKAIFDGVYSAYANVLDAVLEEREACAKLVEEWGDPMGASLQIRARGNDAA